MGTRQSAWGVARAPGATGAVLALFVAAAMLVIGLGVAHACTTRASLYEVSPSSARSGNTVTVKGENFTQDVEIRWNDENGELLATPDGPNFAAQVTIPEAESGSYKFVAIGYDPVGQPAGSDSHPVRVLPAENTSEEPPENSDDSGSDAPSQSSTSGNQGDSDPEGSGSQESDGSGSQEPSSQDSTSPEPSSQDSTSQDSTSPEPSSQDSTSQEPTSHDATSQEPSSQDSTSQEPSSQDSTSPEPSSQDSTSQEPDPAAAGSRDSAGASDPVEEPTSPSNQADNGSRASADETAEDVAVGAARDETARDEAAEATGEAERPQVAEDDGRSWSDVAEGRLSDARHPAAGPSARSGSGDLWAGLESGESQAPGLNEPVGDSDEFAGAGTSEQLAMAAGLIGGGLLLLMGGALVATLHRRRRLAPAQRH